MEHSHNPLPATALCKHCQQAEDQSHVMLDCPHPLLHPIRITARRDQHRIANRLKIKHQTRLDHHFIDHLIYAAWTQPSLSTKRIWLGIWSVELLTSLLPPEHNMLAPLSLQDRYRYIDIAQKLTMPLLQAYNQMISLPSPSPIRIITPLTMKPRHRHHLTTLFPQYTHNHDTPSLTCLSAFTTTNAFTYSDSAFSLTDADIGML